MAHVQHRVGIRGSPSSVYSALIESNHLQGWWATSATGAPSIGSVVELRFGELATLSFLLHRLEENHLVELLCSSGPQPWLNSQLRFALEETEDQTFLTLTHEKDGVDQEAFLYFNTKWPVYMLSLRDYIETGTGRPYPKDTKIHHGD